MKLMLCTTLAALGLLQLRDGEALDFGPAGQHRVDHSEPGFVNDRANHPSGQNTSVETSSAHSEKSSPARYMLKSVDDHTAAIDLDLAARLKELNNLTSELSSPRKRLDQDAADAIDAADDREINALRSSMNALQEAQKERATPSPPSFIQRQNTSHRRGHARAQKEEIFRFRPASRPLIRLRTSSAFRAGVLANSSKPAARAAAEPTFGAGKVEAPVIAGDSNATRQGLISRFTNAAMQHYEKHGLQPNMLLGIALTAFIAIQVAALLCVCWHAHDSLRMLRKARAPNPHASLRKELIPGICWKDWLPEENRRAASQLAGKLFNSDKDTSQVTADKYVRASKISGGNSKQGMPAWLGWNNFWASKKRGAYVPPSGDDGGRAANKSRLQGMIAAERSSVQKCLSPSGAKPEKCDALESTLAVATQRVDTNKRILSHLDHASKRKPSLENMLDSDYDSMLDMEYGAQGLSRH